ncbi:hypothetical protein ACWC09_16770 [Streptomyces sp. NPDC001617]
MLRTTWTRGRRGALLGASAAVVCLGAALAACGGDGREAYVATGSVGGAPQPSGTRVTPTGAVTLVPLNGPTRAGGTPDEKGNSPAGRGTSPDDSATTPGAGASPSADGTKSGRTTAGSPAPTATRSSTAPAALTWSDPTRKATDKRWCEDVALTFTNSGQAAVRSGTVTFGTHIIGLLGIDWGTVESDVALPAPIGGGARKEKTWTVCVDAWRVPLGMHIETRDVTVRWK